ncbi:hypothetical protein PYW07_000730 [Mythimna separata]|uniref:Cyclic nucleotide-binding domain-containing protein n=1 Tax=Mythimna separata TaxID=271217 RepID=A0AAD7YQX3_MYTSE|nr:hypothetical protein PYW07_000730 [Mythimna separata]
MKDENGVPLLASSDIFLEIAGCYIMRNRPDATLTDQSDEICLRASFPCILQPTSSLLVAWNAFVAFLILLCCIAHPYNQVFAKERTLEFRFFDFAVTVVFILDLIVYLSTGANVEEGVPITFAQTSSQQMRSHWFVLDVVATLPIFEFLGDGRFGGMNKLLRLPKLFRVLKGFEESCVYRGNVLRFLSYTLLLLIACYLVAAMQQGFMCFRCSEETCVYRGNVLRFLSYTLLLLIACYLVAAMQQGFMCFRCSEESCVYRGNVLRFLSYTLLLLIACYLVAAMHSGELSSMTWCLQLFRGFEEELIIVVGLMAGYCLVTNFTHSPFWEHKPLDSETIDDRLTFGLYWAISMINFTNHRQTWVATEWRHVMYTLVILEMCVVLRIFMEAVYSATIMVTTSLRENYDSRIAVVKNFLIRNEVDPLLMKRFIAYLQLCWHTDKAYKMTHKKHSNIFYDLPEHVYQNIVGRNRSMYILAVPFLRMVNKEDLKAVTSAVKFFYSSPNEILLNTGELTNEIYVIKQGICEILDPTSRKAIGTLTSKNHFGALICLLRLPAYYTIRAVTHVQVMCIPRKALAKALADPQIIQAINYIKKTPEFQRLQMPVPSFIKYVQPPPTSNLMHFRLPRKHEPDSEFQDPFNKLEFLSILRYVFPRYTIRPDGRYLLRYEWFRLACALCSAQLFPHYTYLVLQWPFLYYVTLFLDLSAYFDIFQRMLIGYFNEVGILVYHPFSTASYYIKGGFITDLFACLPLENLQSMRMDYHENKIRVTPTKQFLMLNRVIQMYRMPGAMNVLKDYIERRDILMVIQAIPLFMAMLNIITCFMVFYSVKIYYSPTDEGYTWYIEPFHDEGGSWMHLFKDTLRFNLTSTPWNMHLATYFWAVYECSSTGYGVFNPSNRDIMQVLFIGMANSAMLTTYYSVRIISIRANVNKSLAGFKQHMKDINVYMAREKLDSELQKELRRYYEYNWEKMGGIDYRGVLKLCDQITLRTDAILHIYGPTFAKCPILANADVSLLRIIGRAVRSVYFLRDMTIIQHNDMVTDMYFVDYGGVEVSVAQGDMNSVLRLPRGR